MFLKHFFGQKLIKIKNKYYQNNCCVEKIMGFTFGQFNFEIRPHDIQCY